MAQVMGRLTKDAVSKTTSENKQLIEFSLVETHTYKGRDGQRKEKTTFYNCTKWNSEALAEHLKKGTAVMINGTIEVNPYMGNDGTAKASLKFTVNRLEFLPSSTKKADKPDATTKNAKPAKTKTIEDQPF